MSIYKTVTVNAQLTSDPISTVEKLSGNLTAQAEVINRVNVNTVSDYNLLDNKPQINSVELIGNRSLPEIGVDTISNMELEYILLL